MKNKERWRTVTDETKETGGLSAKWALGWDPEQKNASGKTGEIQSLWLIVIYQCQFLSFDKCTTFCKMLTLGEAGEGCVRTLCILANFL